MVTSLVVILVAGIIALVLILYFTTNKSTGEALTIDEIAKYSYETPEITTDLEDGSFVRIQFQIITDGKKAYEEVSKREFQIKNILIKELAIMDEESFKSGLTELESTLQTKLNELMTEGNITDVYTISKILQ